MSAIVFEDKKVKGPATHAVVIGVGHYAHLSGGTGKPKYQDPDGGLGQLKSPPVSAREFARWLLETYQNDERPLASLSLLISERTPTKLKFRRGKAAAKSVAVKNADMKNLFAALTDWKARGSKNPEDLMIFYFCGHGIASGTEIALLMEDFGETPGAPLEGALNFRGMHGGMDECMARHQCYFIDACRVGSTLLDKNRGGGTRNPIQAQGDFDPPGGKLRIGPVFYSTVSGAPAYAEPSRPSVFTTALLEALKGAGSSNNEGPWRVGTLRLQEGLDFLMAQASSELKMPLDQIASTENAAIAIPLNTLAAPMVPVLLRVEPPTAQPTALLCCEWDKGKQRRTRLSGDPWRLSLPVARYKFSAEFKNGKFKATPIDDLVTPPYWNKPLRVSP